MNRFKLGCCIIFSTVFLFTFAYASQRVLLSSIKTLTLHEGRFTTGRRSSPIPQLRCVDGKIACKHLPSAVQCYNQGSDGIDVQWKCEAQLPKSVRFDTLQVQCEGYEYPDDPYILAGSCGLTYSLRQGNSKSHKHRSGHQKSAKIISSSDSSSSGIWFVLGAILIMFIIYKLFLAPADRQPPSSSTGPSAPTYEEPPPYHSQNQGQPPPYGFRTEYADSYKRYDDGAAGSASSSGGGFWSGAALGGIAGYLFGSSGSRSNTYYHNDCYSHTDSFAGGAATIFRDSSSSDSSDDAVTSVGYASTRRR